MKVLACCCTGLEDSMDMRIVKPALSLSLGPELHLAGRCGSDLSCQCPARHFGWLRAGAFRSSVKGGIPFQYLPSSFVQLSFLPGPSCGAGWKDGEEAATLYHFPCASTVGSTPAVKAAPVPCLGTCEPFSLDFIPLCLCT